MENQSLLLKIINNEEGFYHGNLRHYFRLMFNAPNASHPNHNFRHMAYVTCMVYEGAKSVRYSRVIGKIGFKALMIASMLHDYDHCLENVDDKINIKRAVDGIEKFILDEDINLLPQIIILIGQTEFPHVKNNFSLGGSLLRDADLSQALSDVWIQQIVFGFAAEWNITPIQVLDKEIDYLSTLDFETTWAKEKFGPLVQFKINEVNELINILS